MTLGAGDRAGGFNWAGETGRAILTKCLSFLGVVGTIRAGLAGNLLCKVLVLALSAAKADSIDTFVSFLAKIAL